MRKGKLLYVKRVTSRGHLYGYFDTGQKDANGKRIYVAIGRFDDPAFGGRYAAMLGRRTARENAGGQITVSKLIDLFQRSPEYREFSKNTRLAYDTYLTVFSKALPTAPANLIERKDILLLIDTMADRPGAANLLLGAIGSLYKWAKDRHTNNEPTKDIARFKLGEHDPWPDHLVEEALSSDNALVRLSVHLLLYTAQRIGDVCGIQWRRDVHRDHIEVVQQKTGKALVIPLHAKLRTELERTPKTGLFVLANENGTAVGPPKLRRVLKEWTRERDADVAAHGLRKNAVNALLEAECSLAETSAISGQTLQMVEHYAKRRNQGKLASAAILKWEKVK